MIRILLPLALACILAAAPATAQLDARATYKDPGTSTLLSVAVPGGGQLYSGETRRGATLLGVGVGGVVLGLAATTSSVSVSCDTAYDCEDDTNYLPLTLGYAAFLGSWIYGIIDADDSAQRMNAKRGFTGATQPRVAPVVASTRRGGTQVGLAVAF